MTIFDKLSAQFSPEAIHWRAQSVTADGSKALALAYLDARDVMDRLDEAVGPANWRDSYEETAKGRLLCTLEIRVDGEWIAKSDGAGNTDVEGEKGAISDALKRAAVKWGIGRYLYELGNIWAPCESYEAGGKKKWKKWGNGAPTIFANALNALGGRPLIEREQPAEIPYHEWSRIVALMQSTNTGTKTLVEGAAITLPNKNLRCMGQDDYAKAIEWLETKLAGMAKAETDSKAKEPA